MHIHTDSPILSSRHSATARLVPRGFTPLRTTMNALRRAVSGFLLVLLAGCGEQEEGERCDLRSGSADCADGLTCTPLERLGQGREGAVCCPADNVSDLICTPATFDLGGDDDDDDETTAPAAHDASSTSHDTSSPLLDAASATDASKTTSDAASNAVGDAAPNPDAADADAADADAADAADADAASDAAPDAADAAQ